MLLKTMETRHILIDTYPDSKYFTTHLAELGFAYETIADFRTAAEWYEKLLAKDSEYAASKDALHSAAIFRERLGDWEQAIANNNLYMSTYPEDERTIGKRIDNAKSIKNSIKMMRLEKHIQLSTQASRRRDFRDGFLCENARG